MLRFLGLRNENENSDKIVSFALHTWVRFSLGGIFFCHDTNANFFSGEKAKAKLKFV
jgi:hypothetical protein